MSSGSFLPSGAAFDSEMSFPLGSNHPYGNPSPIPSPSSLPKSRSHYNRQQSNTQARPSDSYPLSLASMRAAYAAQNNNLSPHFEFSTSSTSNHRAASLSPRASVRSPDRPLPPPSQNPLAHIAPGVVASNLSRSVSADAVAPSTTSLHIVQRLTQQNTLIREAWEAERNYLEANRRRAEEVYQEERMIMEDVREGWESEKAAMLQQIQALKERVQRLEGENSTLKAVTAQSVQITGVVSPQASLVGGASSNNSSSSLVSSRLSPRSKNPTGLSLSDLPPGLDGASRRPHMLSPGSSRISPTNNSDVSYFVPLDPRVQPQHSISKDFLPISPSNETPVPIIDVQEIDPNLEGIPIKAPAVQKSTFGMGASPPPSEASQISSQRSTRHSSPATSPKTHPAALELTQSRSSSKEHTLQVLAAGESRRLTMHAGHTPNHSLSLFPTGNATETNTDFDPSEGATPTAETMALASRQLQGGESSKDVKGKGKAVERFRQSSVVCLPEIADFGELEPIFEPENDRPLKGPLMIRNMPAQDELFWAAVNKKLEPISQGQNSLPTVMQASLDDLEPIAGPSGYNRASQRQGSRVVPIGGDASQDPQASADEAESRDESGNRKNMEADVPLKFKTTTNFGAPFGKM